MNCILGCSDFVLWNVGRQAKPSHKSVCYMLNLGGGGQKGFILKKLKKNNSFF